MLWVGRTECTVRALTSIFVLLLTVGSALAQDSQADAPLPGGHFRGRYVGFQPKYGRVPPPLPPHRKAVSANSAADEGVAQASYQATQGMSHVGPGEMIISEGAAPGITQYSPGPADCGLPTFGVPAVSSGVASFWGSAEYLIFWTKGMSTPALATTSPDGTVQDQAGVLGLASTTTLFGGNDQVESSRPGGRYSIGYWLTPMRLRALEFTYLNLDSESERFTASNADFSILGRPFFDTDASEQDARLIVFPGLVEGSLDIQVETEFETAEILIRTPTARCNGCLDYFFGYRYAKLEDLLSFNESTLSLSGPTQDATFVLNDRLASENEFHGGQLGVQFSSQSSPQWSMDLLAKIALGNTRSQISNSGSTIVTTANGASSTQNAGLLTQGTNSGVFESDEFSTITEFGATLRRHLNCNVALTVGYTFLLWTDVVRAGDNLDTNINVTQIPPGVLTGEARPAVNDGATDFWAQGLRLGLEGRF